MIEAPVRSIHDVIAEFLACNPVDEKLLTVHMPQDLQARLNFLLDLNGADELCRDEAQELDELLRANGFVSLLKAKVRRRERLGTS